MRKNMALFPTVHCVIMGVFFNFLQEKDLTEKAQAHPAFARAVQEALGEVGLPSSILMPFSDTAASTSMGSSRTSDNNPIETSISPIHCVS